MRLRGIEGLVIAHVRELLLVRGQQARVRSNEGVRCSTVFGPLGEPSSGTVLHAEIDARGEPRVSTSAWCSSSSQVVDDVPIRSLDDGIPAVEERTQVRLPGEFVEIGDGEIGRAARLSRELAEPDGCVDVRNAR